jgi:hypothetical protein
MDAVRFSSPSSGFGGKFCTNTKEDPMTTVATKLAELVAFYPAQAGGSAL